MHGRVTFDGTDVSKLSEARRDRWRRDHIGLVFQNFHLIEELSPRDNVMVAAWFDRLSAAKLRERADSLLEGLGVPATAEESPWAFTRRAAAGRDRPRLDVRSAGHPRR